MIWGGASFASAVEAETIGIVLERDADEREARVAGVLETRIEQRSRVEVAVGAKRAKEADLRVYLGRHGRDGALDELAAAHGVTLPGRNGPAPEGYAVKTIEIDGAPAIIAVGADDRGTLYAVGEILRRMRFEPDAVVVGDIDVATTPAYRIRGSSANQGGTMMRVTGARTWTQEEWQSYVLDLALSGANYFYAHGAQLDFVKSFDLMAETGCRPNELGGAKKEWLGTEFGHWICPSIPEAKAAVMERWQRELPARGDYDCLRFFAGDPGGCRCEKCTPWGKTFIHLCEEIAAIWLESHPDSVVMIANQDISNAGDQAIFDYLNEKPRDWLYAIAYGPGSNAMSKYFRPELREDLFVYPGHGPVNRYLAETLNQLPRYQRIVHYSDITHWISAQYQVEHPEPHLISVYGRRTFHTRPRAFYGVFQAIMPFSEGDIIYSEGYHDEFHQYLWNRLLWDPSRSLEDVAGEYCRYHFGEAAAPLMQEALYQLEENLEAPLVTNPGIGQYYLLVKEAGWLIPPHLRAANRRWRLHMQKAALDKYLQLKARGARDRRDRVIAIARRADDVNAAIAEAAAQFDEPLETPGMAALKDEARRLGEETEALFGVRNVGYFSLDKRFRSLYRLGYLVRQAAEAESAKERRKLLQEIADFEPLKTGRPMMKAGEE